jgi:proline dehydrogenase
MLRTWALDENLKARVMASPELSTMAKRIARRYIAGETSAEAIDAAHAGMRRGHLPSIEYTGESVRDAQLARSETDVFLRLITAVKEAGLPSTISFDLSHVGSIIDPALALAHVRQLARASVDLGTAVMISAEASDRTDLVLDLYEELAKEHPHLGITVQARLHRTPGDLDRVLRHPGPIRLVKGAFLESEQVAYRRGSDELMVAYLELARRLIDSGHPVSLATHDEVLVTALIDEHGSSLIGGDTEFEMLMGLGTDLLDDLHRQGYRTREYVIFGREWWLYVLNRIAEHPDRVITALADLNPAAPVSG